MNKQIGVEDIELALKKKEFFLYYQPKVSMIDGEVCGAEVLLRWQTATGSFIPPAAYIPLAEEAGIITKITKYVFSYLVEELPRILAINQNLVISFNASGKDFHNHDFTDFVRRYLKGNKCLAKNIEIEVTESVLLDEENARVNLAEIAEMGITISMDDFSTGHSSLAGLGKWPFSVIKIDKNLVNGIYKSAKDTEILQSSLRMAHQLGMEVVAEGIEDEYTFNLLQKYGCKTAQGYWISRPLVMEEFLSFIKHYKRRKTFPVGQLYMAQLDHLQWKKTLIDTALHMHNKSQGHVLKAIKGGMPKLNHCCCKLGDWYYSAEKYFGHLEEYRKLEVHHKKLHKIGEYLMRTASENCKSHELRKLIRRLTEQSVIIIDLLQSLENHWLIHQHVGTVFES